jgi:hypothetical protein
MTDATPSATPPIAWTKAPGWRTWRSSYGADGYVIAPPSRPGAARDRRRLSWRGVDLGEHRSWKAAALAAEAHRGGRGGLAAQAVAS